MPSPILTAGELAAIRSGYAAQDYLLTCPNTVVFQAQVATAPTAAAYASLAYNTVTVGAYTDIKLGQVVLVSPTTDLRGAVWRGRVRRTPTASLLYVNETSAALSAGAILTVIDTYEVAERLRRASFVDFDFVYSNVPPVIRNMPSTVAAHTSGTASFSFAPVGQAMASGATIASYAWDIPGATYTTGSASTQNITVTVPQGHRWGRLTVTDSNGVVAWYAFEIYVCDMLTSPLAKRCLEPVDVSAAWDTGYNASFTAWDEVSAVLDRTRVSVATVETYPAGGASFPLVRCVGYLTKDSDTARGDARHGLVREARVEVAGLLTLAGELPFNPIAIQDKAAPTRWDEMTFPTTQRAITHVLAQHSTLLNLCSLDFDVTDNTWYGGSMNVDTRSLMDAVQGIASEISAVICQDANGPLILRRNANLLSSTARNALSNVTPSAVGVNDIVSFSLEHAHKSRIGRITVGFRRYLTADGSGTNIIGSAPAAANGEGQEESEIPNQLLAANASLANAQLEARERTGHLYAYAQPADTLNVTFSDGWGILSPAVHQWYTFDLPATYMTRQWAIPSSVRWLCLSVTHRLGEGGTRDVQAQFRRESAGGAAMVVVSIPPVAIPLDMVILPVQSAYGGSFVPDGSINMPSLTAPPPPFDPFNMPGGLPLPADQAAAEAALQPRPGCRVIPVSFKNPSNTNTGFSTVLGQAYTLKVSGTARTKSNVYVYDFRQAAHDWIPSFYAYAPMIRDSAGWHSGVYNGRRWVQLTRNFFAGLTFTHAVVDLDFTAGIREIPGLTHWIGFVDVAGWSQDYAIPPTTPLLSVSIPNYTSPFITVQIIAGYKSGAFEPDPGGDVVVRSITLTTNELPRYADAFYSWQQDSDGNPTDVQLINPTGGLFLDNAAPPVPPPFNPAHEYSLNLTGTGNPIAMRFQDSDYTDNQNVLLYVEVCGPNAGQ